MQLIELEGNAPTLGRHGKDPVRFLGQDLDQLLTPEIDPHLMREKALGVHDVFMVTRYVLFFHR
jgi:hypothetical protein